MIGLEDPLHRDYGTELVITITFFTVEEREHKLVPFLSLNLRPVYTLAAGGRFHIPFCDHLRSLYTTNHRGVVTWGVTTGRDCCVIIETWVDNTTQVNDFITKRRGRGAVHRCDFFFYALKQEWRRPEGVRRLLRALKRGSYFNLFSLRR